MLGKGQNLETGVSRSGAPSPFFCAPGGELAEILSQNLTAQEPFFSAETATALRTPVML